MNDIKQIFKVVITLIICSLIVSCSNEEGKMAQELADRQISLTEKAKINEITLAAVGDILIHDRVYNDVLEDDEYNFKPMLREVKKYLIDADITFANQETMIGGEEIGLSSYPQFNSPVEIADALKDAGVDIVSIANNHSMDRGEKAIMNSIDYWNQTDMTYVGAYKSKEDKQVIRVMETSEDISVAFLAYTYGTNGIPVPENKRYLVNLIDKKEIKEAIKQAKEVADAVVLSLHFGNEYERMPNDTQKELVQYAADEGVDIVLGHHPHVLQPVEWIEGQDGNETFAIYSLGNFLSGQDGLYKQVGGVLNLTIKKVKIGEHEEVKVEAPEFAVTYMESTDEQNYINVPMYTLNNKVLHNHEQRYEEIKNHMSQWVPELKINE